MLFKRKKPPQRNTNVVDDMELEHQNYLQIGRYVSRFGRRQIAILRIWHTIPVRKISTHVQQITVKRHILVR